MACGGRWPQNRKMKLSFRQRPFLAVVFLLFSLWCWQVFWWRHQAVQITWFQIKSITHLITPSERLEWGAICNGLGDFDCAAAAFGKLVNQKQGRRIALSNFAIAEAQRENCASAMKLFDTYRAGGPEGPETLYWSAKCLLKLKRPEEARMKLYLSTAMGPESTEAPEALVDLLFQQGLKEEALSVIGALTNGRPSRSDRWRAKYSELALRMRMKDAEIGVNAEVGRRSLRVPCLDGQNFWMPVKFSAEASPEFVAIDPEQSAVTFNEEHFVQRLPAAQTAANAQVFPALQIGPWLFRDVEYGLCSNCTSVIGRALLDHFEISEDMDAGVRFLILTPN